MKGDKDMQRLDALLAGAFAPGGESCALPGFEARVMARIADVRREPTLWDILRMAARPILVSGWAAAAVLGVLALKGVSAGGDMAVAALVNGDAMARWMAL
jgi:hypothetical protein